MWPNWFSRVLSRCSPLLAVRQRTNCAQMYKWKKHYSNTHPCMRRIWLWWLSTYSQMMALCSGLLWRFIQVTWFCRYDIVFKNLLNEMTDEQCADVVTIYLVDAPLVFFSLAFRKHSRLTEVQFSCLNPFNLLHPILAIGHWTGKEVFSMRAASRFNFIQNTVLNGAVKQ